MSKPDLLYIVGPGSDHHPELRWSLRSVAANLPHRNVIIVGHCPTWVRHVTYVATAQVSKVKYRNALHNLMAGLGYEGTAPNVVLMNDDFYAMTPGIPAPVAHRGTFRDVLDHQLRGKNSRNNDYVWGLELAEKHLRDEHGITDPLCYELHQPLPMDRERALDILGRYEVDDHMAGVAKRSLYGNLAGIGGDKVDDPRPLRHGFWEWDWISSNDDSFQPGYKTRTYLEHRFPEPCYYEDARTAPRITTTALVCTANDKSGGTLKVLRAGDPKIKVMLGTGVWRVV